MEVRNLLNLIKSIIFLMDSHSSNTSINTDSQTDHLEIQKIRMVNDYLQL